MKPQFHLVLAAFMLTIIFALPARADTLVDTGPGDSDGGLSLFNSISADGQFQNLAGEFTIGSPFSITSVEAWMVNSTIAGGFLTVVLRDDNSGLPGTLLFAQSFFVGENPTAHWEQFSGMNWQLPGGTYWIALEPVSDSEFEGSMPSGVPNPLSSYAILTAAPAGWRQLHPSDVLGFRISGVAEPSFTQIVVFGDSLSDTGNIAHRARDEVFFSYPSGNFNYSDYRFTNSSDTTPSSDRYVGVWHEQLAHTFLHLPIATNSLDGGLNYAFGGATTIDGSSQRTIINNPIPFGGGDFEITIDNMGKQVADYLASFTPDPNALYLLWGGGNDLFDDSSPEHVIATSTQVNTLITRLATAGARKFLVPNVPPLGAIPHYVGHTSEVISLDAASADYRARLNADLDATISALAAQGIVIQVYRVDVWLDLIRILTDPSKYGFTNVRDSAQFETGTSADKYLFWDDIHPTTAGHYQIAAEATRVLTGEIQSPAKALNVSTRAAVGNGDDVTIIGFIITGTDAKKVLLRGIGPSLSANGVSGPLADPTLTLYDSAGGVLTSNDNWRDTQQAEIRATGAPPTNDLESAIVRTLNPGRYTAVLRGKNNGTGIGLVEVYDRSATANSVLANLSTRGFVGSGENVMIAGLIVGNGDQPILALRAVGPSLTSQGIAGALQDPTLELHDKDGALITTNDNWKTTQDSAVAACGIAPGDTREPAIVRSLAPGRYTAIVRGKNNTTGVALIEAYRIQ